MLPLVRPKMPPKKKKAPAKAAAAPDHGEMQQQGYIRQALQSNVVSLKERVKALAEDNEALRKTRTRVRSLSSAARMHVPLPLDAVVVCC